MELLRSAEAATGRIGKPQTFQRFNRNLYSTLTYSARSRTSKQNTSTQADNFTEKSDTQEQGAQLHFLSFYSINLGEKPQTLHIMQGQTIIRLQANQKTQEMTKATENSLFYFQDQILQ